jgi:Yip1 domain
MSETQNQIEAGAPAYAAPQTAAPPPQPEEPARLNAFQRLIGTLFSPGETFKDVNRKPTWLVPVLISMVLFSAGSFFYEWRAKPDWDKYIRLELKKALERRGQDMPEEQVNRQVAVQKKIAQFIPLIAPVFVPIGNLVLAGIFALGMMLLQAKTTFKKIFSVVAWTSAGLGLVGFIVRVAVLMTANEEALSNSNPRQQGADLMPTHVGWFLPEGTSGPLKSFADSLDVFSFWVMIVMAVGLAAISGNKRITTKKSFAMLFGLWLVYVVIKVALSTVFG